MTNEQIEAARAETERLCHELDIANADHVALWLETNMPGASLAWLACHIVDAHEAALSAQQAAGEAEAVVTVEAVCSNRPRPTVARSGKHGGGQWWARDVWHIAAAENKTLCGLDRSDWLTIGQTKLNSDCCKRCSRLYATPQPTETQRIVAWLRSASQAARDHHAEVCRHEDDEILDAIITRMETYAFAADQIERGVHLPSSEHLAGESK